MNEEGQLLAEERVELKKYEGEPSKENEFERITIVNGIITSHDIVENGEPVGPVGPEDNLTGKNVGMLTSKEVD